MHDIISQFAADVYRGLAADVMSTAQMTEIVFFCFDLYLQYMQWNCASLHIQHECNITDFSRYQ